MIACKRRRAKKSEEERGREKEREKYVGNTFGS
jgi:hypothetical protein